MVNWVCGLGVPLEFARASPDIVASIALSSATSGSALGDAVALLLAVAAVRFRSTLDSAATRASRAGTEDFGFGIGRLLDGLSGCDASSAGDCVAVVSGALAAAKTVEAAISTGTSGDDSLVEMMVAAGDGSLAALAAEAITFAGSVAVDPLIWAW